VNRMADKVETSRPEGDLTDSKAVQESTEGSTEPTLEPTEVPDDANNWQHALQKSREREKAKEEEMATLRKELKKIQDTQKAQKLSELGEAERYKTIAEEESAKRGKLEMRVTVQEALAGKNIPQAIRELILETPWAIPPVAKELDDDFTWDEAIDAVQRHLPEYVDSLVAETSSKKEPSGDNSSESAIDPERSIENTVVKEHVYTRQEIERLQADPKEWEKHRESILKQLQSQGGTIR